MKIGVFAYNFKHKKTQEGLINLFLHNIPITCILAADPVELKFYQSEIRVSQKGLDYIHPNDIAGRLNIPYHVVVHNSEECEQLIDKHELDVGIILGARIIKKNIIDKFKIGIINMHPGLLPQNRGLDTIKWAILKGYKQGVSCHLISKEIDRGQLIIKREVDVHEDDSLVDIFFRIQNMEQNLLIESLKMIQSGKKELQPVSEGNYNKSVPPELEEGLLEKFEEYKRDYNKL